VGLFCRSLLICVPSGVSFDLCMFYFDILGGVQYVRGRREAGAGSESARFGRFCQ